MTEKIIAFIGAGNMARSLIGGLIADNYPASHIFVSDPDPEKLALLEATFNINTAEDNEDAALAADVIILAVKPQHISEAAESFADVVKEKKPLIVCIAAGITLAILETFFGDDAAIVRCMPNTPALIGSGATGLFANDNVGKVQREISESIMRAVGVTVWLESEEQLKTVTALSGSGPAYYFLIMEALQTAAIEAGLNQQTAELLSKQTVLGAARMALESGRDVASLREQVTSPGGTTEAAIAVLQSRDIQNIFKEALQAAITRAEELANSGDK